MKLRRSIIAGAAMFALAVTGCAAGNGDNGAPGTPDESDLPPGVAVDDTGRWVLERNDPIRGGTLRVGSPAPVEALDPTGLTTSFAYGAIYDQLLKTDDAGNISGQLAESMSTDDGRVWTLKLRSGVTFHDGTPLDSAAVAFHIERLGAEGSRSSAAGDARNMIGLDTPDATTLIITLATPSMTFPALFVAGPLSHIPSPTAVEAHGDSYPLHPVGAGPFKLVSFQSGGDVVLERNPDYYRSGLPYLDGLVFVAAVDSQTRYAAVVAGDIDLADTQAGTDLRNALRDGLTPLHQPSYGWYSILFNLSKPPFDDVRFREAFIRGIDLEAISDSVFDGLNEPMTGQFPPVNPMYIDTDWPSYDPEKAKQLVDEWKADTGLEPEFTITTTSPPEFQKQTAIMQQMLADIGIDMSINVGDQPTMFTEGISGNFTAQHRTAALAPESFQALTSSYGANMASNASHGSNDELDRVLALGRMAIDQAEREKYAAEAQKIFREWLPGMPQLRHTVGWYAGSKVGGVPAAIPGWGNKLDFALLYTAS